MRESPSLPDKPRLRGVSHQIAFFLALVAGGFLVLQAPSPEATFAAGVYATCTACMFGASALYHRLNCTERARQRLRRLDHSAIFLMIAGSYTPVATLALPDSIGSPLLHLLWICTALAIVQKVAWPQAPKAVSVGLYLLIGWIGLPYLPRIAASMGPVALGLILASGLLYTFGALVYALRRPDPFPRTFGYHEIFHALVIAACALHFTAIYPLLIPG